MTKTMMMVLNIIEYYLLQFRIIIYTLQAQRERNNVEGRESPWERWRKV